MSKFSDQSTPEEYFEAANHVNPEQNAFQNQSQYECLVLSKPVLLPGYTEGDTIRKYSFQGRIMDEKMTHEKFLSNPCERATVTDVGKNDKLLCMHPTIEFTAYDGHPPDFSTNDRVEASCLPGNKRTIYNMQYMKFDKTKAIYSNTIADVSIDCQAYADRDWSDAADLGGAGALGITDIPMEPTGITLHYTAGFSVEDTISVLEKRGLAYHYIIARSGIITTLAEPNVRVWHNPATNHIDVGVAFANLGYQEEFAGQRGTVPIEQWIEERDTNGKLRKWEPYTAEQIRAALLLFIDLNAQYPTIVDSNIKQHSETSGGKHDGGPALELHIPAFKAVFADDDVAATSDAPAALAAGTSPVSMADDVI